MFVALVLLELGLRLFSPQHLQRSEGLWVANPHTVFAMAPNFRGRQVGMDCNVVVATNGRGLRDRDFAYEKPPGTLRVLALGDSFCYGSGVEAAETYPKRLEGILKTPARPAEVINAGVSGYGTWHALQFLRHEGLRYRPDIVLLGVLPTNDLADNLDPDRYRAADGELVRRGARRGGLHGFKRFLRLRSHLYRFVGDRYHAARQRLGLRSVILSERYTGVFRTDYPATIAEGWKKTETYLAEMAAVCRDNGIPFRVICIPRLYQFDAKSWAQFDSLYGGNGITLDPQRPDRHLEAVCRDLKTPVLLLLPLLREHPDPASLYLPINGHWSPAGHAAVARHIADFLKKNP
jgi:lysophospholipase L1-like esterase